MLAEQAREKDPKSRLMWMVPKKSMNARYLSLRQEDSFQDVQDAGCPGVNPIYEAAGVLTRARTRRRSLSIYSSRRWLVIVERHEKFGHVLRVGSVLIPSYRMSTRRVTQLRGFCRFRRLLGGTRVCHAT